jgi:hypothetical protein
MTNEKKKLYQDTDELRDILTHALKGKKFRLDCGHHVSFNHNLGNNVMIYNGKKLEIICSLCSY